MNTYVEPSQRQISYDTATGRVNGIRDVEGMYTDIHELLKKFWPKWTGEFTIEYPTHTDSSSAPDEIITARIRKIIPLRTDTAFSRGGTPDTKVPNGGMITPKLMRQVYEPTTNDVQNIWTQFYEGVVRFTFYAKTNGDTYALAMKFMKFMRKIRPQLISRGLQNIYFQLYSEEEKVNDVWAEVLKTSVADYFIQYQDIWSELAPTLRSTQVQLAVVEDEDSMEISEIPESSFITSSVLGLNNGIKNPIIEEGN